MWEIIVQAVAERQVEVARLPDGVKAWVAFMRGIFFAGIVFAPWFKFPRFVILTMVLTAFIIILGKIFFPQVDTIIVGTVSQLILWTPLLIYLLYNLRQNIILPFQSGRKFSVIYGVWVAIVGGTITISHGFNLVGVVKFIVS
ncbi:MAG: hypothetical protein V3V04_01620 [Rhizobiaceae bacterium]